MKILTISGDTSVYPQSLLSDISYVIKSFDKVYELLFEINGGPDQF